MNPQRIPNKEIAGALLARILGLDAAKLQADLEAAAASKSASQLQAKMKAKYPKLAMDIVLQIGAGAQFPATVAERAKN